MSTWDSDGDATVIGDGKQRRRLYTLSFKLDIVKQVTEKFGGNLYAAARTTGIDRKQLRSWIQTAGKLNSVSKKRSAKRIPGGGRPAFFPEMEAELFSWFVDQTQKKMAVTYNRLRAYVQTIRQKFNLPPEFLVSNHWIQNFCKRMGISCRRITHHGQQDRRHPDVLRDIVQEYLDSVMSLSTGLEPSRIFNMDEIPTYIDMLSGTTSDFVGQKNVDADSTGANKCRFTVVLCCNAAGDFTKTMDDF